MRGQKNIKIFVVLRPATYETLSFVQYEDFLSLRLSLALPLILPYLYFISPLFVCLLLFYFLFKYFCFYQYLYKYKGWNSNSGNYLFTTDTK